MQVNMQRSAPAVLRRIIVRMAGAAFLLSAGVAAAERLHKYTVAVDAELSTLSVRACFSGAAPATLSAESLDDPLTLIDFQVKISSKSIEPSGSISLKSVPEDGCVAYRVDVSRPSRQHDRTGDKIHPSAKTC
jgi:hypothetical protein